MILPPATLGVLGGGQLGRYFVYAAHEMGYRVVVLDPDVHSIAGQLADEHIVAHFADRDALDIMAQKCVAITTEFENVPAESLSRLAESIPVRPSAESLATCQNRRAEKEFLSRNSFSCAPYLNIDNANDIDAIPAELLPGILKVARLGYDGKGQQRVTSHDDTRAAFSRFNGEPCVLERMMPLDSELSVVLVRDENGKIEGYNATQNHHSNGILDYAITPDLDTLSNLTAEARNIAAQIAQRMNYIGTLAVEFFVVNGKLLVNEIAPRPHNSGHHTLDSCVTNQFEQQVRALCGLPLGLSQQHSAAVMVNLLGDLWYLNDAKQAHEPDWYKLLSIPNLKLHLYGKHEARPGRKMGHFTVLGNNPQNVREIALSARAAIGIRDE